MSFGPDYIYRHKRFWALSIRIRHFVFKFRISVYRAIIYLFCKSLCLAIAFVAALLSGSEMINDPFVPMRGRRFSNQALRNAFIAMRGQRLATSDWDDPFVPMRGRKADSWDDPFIPMRGRRGNGNNNGAAREQRSKPIPADLYLNDPFIPMRGRRSTPAHHQQQRMMKGMRFF